MTDPMEFDDSFFNREALLGSPDTLAPELDKPASTLGIRFIGALLLVAIAVIHYLDFGDRLEETPYIGYLYIALIVTSLVFAVILLLSKSVFAWQAAVTIAASTFLGFIISRTTGLPQSSDDIGNWTETLGIVALAVEGTLVLLGLYAAKTANR